MNLYQHIKLILTPIEQRQAWRLLALMFAGMILEIVGISLIVPVIALMTNPAMVENNPTLTILLKAMNYPDQYHLVIGSMLLLLGFYVLKTFFMIYITWKQNKFSYTVLAALSQRLFKLYLYQPWSFYLQNNSSHLITNITSEPAVFITNTLRPGMQFITESLVLLGVSGFLFYMQPMATSLTVTMVGVCSWIYFSLIRKKLLRWGENRQFHEMMRYHQLQQGLGGLKDVKLLGCESNFLEQHQVHNLGTAESNQKLQTLTEMPRLGLELFAIVALVGLVLVMIAKGTAIEKLAPTLGLFAAAAFRLIPSVNRIIGALQALRFGLPVVQSLSRELQSLAQPIQEKGQGFFSFEQTIRLTKICYRYKDRGEKALDNINIKIPKGASIGFVGTSGAGKSTLIDIILGLLQPTSGEVNVDGVNIKENIRGWQNQIGYVPQVIFLTDDTLRRNIAFGIPEPLIDDHAVEKAILLAQLTDFVKTLPEGLNTSVGERGVRLSGGQRQRIGIARALYHNPPVLVLDEATSALDMKTEREVMNAVNLLQGQKTLLIIAHRLSTVANCDYLYKMEAGKVVQEGSFKDITSEFNSNSKTDNLEVGLQG